MCWNGKNPQKALQYHSRRKLQPTHRPTNIHTKKIKNVYTEIQRVKNVETFNLACLNASFFPLPHPLLLIFALALFFARAKRRKLRFFVLCSTETLATQATFNLKSATDDASLISRGRLFHFPTILFIKLNLNKLVLERLVKRFGVSILLNAYPLSTSLENPTLESRVSRTWLLSTS